jgi:hypothetical protein
MGIFDFVTLISRLNAFVVWTGINAFWLSQVNNHLNHQLYCEISSKVIMNFHFPSSTTLLHSTLLSPQWKVTEINLIFCIPNLYYSCYKEIFISIIHISCSYRSLLFLICAIVIKITPGCKHFLFHNFPIQEIQQIVE